MSTSSVTMPALGESIREGTVTRWLKQEGEQVQVDEPLLEVSTDKVDTEVVSPATGVLRKILISEDETVDVGTVLAVIGDGASGNGGSGGADPDAGSGAGRATATVPGAHTAQRWRRRVCRPARAAARRRGRRRPRHGHRHRPRRACP
ncbi:hypothetical protein FAIPA1_540007 [Frankia sp. AiPs1]